ncbi:protocadherin Fat 2 isoform X1 [Pelobates cultripes]|uniref:Protocadherin Fat 2 isoform X1 n=1 Tax=Pelobates cultripes TaxID=61616 RepID=A0AAD1VW46_PELCU|nr:protocadherin Fat 2 isoform X1 [Pelobates cultripes]
MDPGSISITGVISTTRSLNYEMEASKTFMVKVVSMDGLVERDSAFLTVNLVDEDEPPKCTGAFGIKLASERIDENYQMFHQLYTVPVTDDDGLPLSEFRLMIKATDTTGLSCEGGLIIYINDLNDELPIFEIDQRSVNRFGPNGQRSRRNIKHQTTTGLTARLKQESKATGSKGEQTPLKQPDLRPPTTQRPLAAIQRVPSPRLRDSAPLLWGNFSSPVLNGMGGLGLFRGREAIDKGPHTTGQPAQRELMGRETRVTIQRKHLYETHQEGIRCPSGHTYCPPGTYSSRCPPWPRNSSYIIQEGERPFPMTYEPDPAIEAKSHE